MNENPTHLRPMPDGWISHSIILLQDSMPPFKEYLDLLPKMFPSINTRQAGWAVQAGERKRMFGPMRDGDWVWHLYFESAKLPDELHGLALGHKPSDDLKRRMFHHKSHALMFLLERPEKATALETWHHLTGVVWPWLAVGGEVLAWPDSQKTWLRGDLLPLNPLALGPDEVGMFLTNEAAARDPEDRLWLRTRGMQTFGLPDLVTTVSPNPTDEDLVGVDTLFSSMAPYLVDRGTPLPPGDTIQLEDHLWKTEVLPPDEVPFFSRFGFQFFSLARIIKPTP